MMYFYDENFLLPLSHDEVVHGKSPMIYKMPGDDWQKFANLRLLYTYMYTHPGGKLLFMGNEIAQTTEWNYHAEIDWHLLVHEPHKKMQNCVIELNKLYRSEPALYEYHFNKKGFEWIDVDHRNESVIVYMRKGVKEKDNILAIFNMTPVTRKEWKIQVHQNKDWRMIFNSDDARFWGAGYFDTQPILTKEVDKKSGLYEINLDLPALGAILLK